MNRLRGKRMILVVMGGEFGRDPDDVASGRDGHDHWADGFSWAMLSFNQPTFKTTAVGDTGPDTPGKLRSSRLASDDDACATDRKYP